jgi:hypothetical protein
MSFILVPLVLHLKKGMHFPHSGKLHRITTVFMKVKTNIIASITAFSLTRQFVILVIMYVDIPSKLMLLFLLVGQNVTVFGVTLTCK